MTLECTWNLCSVSIEFVCLRVNEPLQGMLNNMILTHVCFSQCEWTFTEDVEQHNSHPCLFLSVWMNLYRGCWTTWSWPTCVSLSVNELLQGMLNSAILAHVYFSLSVNEPLQEMLNSAILAHVCFSPCEWTFTGDVEQHDPRPCVFLSVWMNLYRGCWTTWSWPTCVSLSVNEPLQGMLNNIILTHVCFSPCEWTFTGDVEQCDPGPRVFLSQCEWTFTGDVEQCDPGPCVFSLLVNEPLQEMLNSAILAHVCFSPCEWTFTGDVEQCDPGPCVFLSLWMNLYRRCWTVRSWPMCVSLLVNEPLQGMLNSAILAHVCFSPCEWTFTGDVEQCDPGPCVSLLVNEPLQGMLNNMILADVRGGKDGLSQVVLAVDIVMKQSIYGYHGNQKTPFLKITMALPKYNATARRLLEKGFTFPGYLNHVYKAYESNIDFEIRYEWFTDHTFTSKVHLHWANAKSEYLPSTT